MSNFTSAFGLVNNQIIPVVIEQAKVTDAQGNSYQGEVLESWREFPEGFVTEMSLEEILSIEFPLYKFTREGDQLTWEYSEIEHLFPESLDHSLVFTRCRVKKSLSIKGGLEEMLSEVEMSIQLS